MGKCLWLNLPLLFHRVHVHSEPEPISTEGQLGSIHEGHASIASSHSQSQDIRRESSHTEHDSIRDREYLNHIENGNQPHCETDASRPKRDISREVRLKHTFSKLVAIVNAWLPNRRSDAIATQFLPTMATTDPPLYSIIDCI
jgi:hypothetical protein